MLKSVVDGTIGHYTNGKGFCRLSHLSFTAVGRGRRANPKSPGVARLPLCLDRISVAGAWPKASSGTEYSPVRLTTSNISGYKACVYYCLATMPIRKAYPGCSAAMESFAFHSFNMHTFKVEQPSSLPKHMKKLLKLGPFLFIVY